MPPSGRAAFHALKNAKGLPGIQAAIKKLGIAKVMRGSSKQLGKQLDAAGQKAVRQGQHAAHLVPRPTKALTGPAAHPQAKNMQKILARNGIHVDDAINGKWLDNAKPPGGGAYHGWTHRDVFQDELSKVLTAADRKGPAAVQKALDSVKRGLDDIPPWPYK